MKKTLWMNLRFLVCVVEPKTLPAAESVLLVTHLTTFLKPGGMLYFPCADFFFFFLHLQPSFMVRLQWNKGMRIYETKNKTPLGSEKGATSDQ